MGLPFFLICMLIVALSLASVPGQGKEISDVAIKIEAVDEVVPAVATGRVSADTAYARSLSAERAVEADEAVVEVKPKTERRRRAEIDERFDFLLLLLQVLQGPK